MEFLIMTLIFAGSAIWVVEGTRKENEAMGTVDGVVDWEMSCPVCSSKKIRKTTTLFNPSTASCANCGFGKAESYSMDEAVSMLRGNYLQADRHQ